MPNNDNDDDGKWNKKAVLLLGQPHDATVNLNTSNFTRHHTCSSPATAHNMALLLSLSAVAIYSIQQKIDILYTGELSLTEFDFHIHIWYA